MMKHKPWVLSMWLFGVFAITMLQGCGEESKPAVKAVKKDGEKLDIYIKCFNLADRIDESFAKYVKDTKNNKPKENLYVIGVDVQKIAKCQHEVSELVGTTPTTELDKAALDFVNNSVATAKVLNTLHDYYSEKNYKDDNFKKGLELHDLVLENGFKFLDSESALSAMISAANDKRQLKRLAEIEKKQGKKDAYYRLSIMIQSKQILRMFVNKDISLDQLKGDLETYEQTIEQATSYYEDPKLNIVSPWKFFIFAAKEFSKSAKERYRSIRDNKPIHSADSTTTGSLKNLHNNYNKLVHFFNN